MEPRKTSTRLRNAVLLGAAVPLGLACFDVGLFLGTDRPAAVAALAFAQLVAILGGALLGGVVTHLRRLRPVVLALFVLLASAPGLFGLATTAAERALGPTLLVAFALWWLAATLARGLEPARSLALGVGLGLLGGSGLFLLEGGGLAWFALVPGLALCVAAWPDAGRAVVAAVLVVAAATLAPRAHHAWRASRPIPSATPTGAASGAKPSAILVVLDTVRADRLGSYGYERNTTPRLDAFAAEHMTRHVAAHSTSSWTLPSHASLFTGLAPAEHGVTHPRGVEPGRGDGTWARPSPLPAELPTLAGRLRAAGWRTGAVIANHMLGRWTGLDRGFGHYDDRPEARIGNHQAFFQVRGRGALAGHLPYRDAHEITDLALDWLGNTDEGRPFFLFLNYMDAHTPYTPPAPFDTLFDEARPKDELRPREPELASLLYDRELAYLDAEVGRLLSTLEERGLLEDTLLIVTSDHGEAFGEHGFWSHDWALYEEHIRVPLFVKLPGGRRSVESDVPLDGTDVHDLILETLGVISPTEDEQDLRPDAEWFSNPSLGREKGVAGPPLEELARDLAVWFEGSEKWIVSSEGEVTAFDLARDPSESNPLPLEPAARERALTRARAWWSAHPPRTPKGEDLDRKTLERLRELGYAGDDEP